uniref:Type 2 C1q domain-containing protein 4 isoform 3 n=1 Tax=Littorina littorea TaxID=31216 RepID=A0A411DER4_LITLI|nr:type 2 C1q domain-containing protein 4 isoform 3 [Littorina littorea]
MYALLAFGLVLSVGSSRGAEKVREAIRSQNSLDFLETIVKQQVTLTQSLQAALNAEKSRAKAEELSLKNALTAAKSEYNIKLTTAKSEYNRKLKAAQSEITTLWAKVNRSSKAVGFTARFLNDDGAGIPIGHRATLRFDDVVFNAGNGYDPHTGIFTAPVAGTYAFFFNLMAFVNGKVEILKNGKYIDYVWANSNNDQGASQLLVHLEDGGKVWVRQLDIHSLRGGPYTIFTGYLLQAD